MMIIEKKHKKIMVILLFFLFLNTSFIQLGKSNIIYDDHLDQQQTKGFIEESFQDEQWKAQGFRPRFGVLTKVELFMCRCGPISTDFSVSIRDSLNGDDLSKVSLSSLNVSISPGWISCDLPDINLEFEESYYIICRTAVDDSDHHLIWYRGNNTDYTRGTGYRSMDNGSTWSAMYNSDFCFKTYGKNSNQSQLDLVCVIGGAEGLTGQTFVEVANNGYQGIDNISVNINFNGGFIITPRNYWNTFEFILPPKGKIHVIIHPVIGFGKSTINITISAVNVTPINQSVDAFLLPIYVYIPP